MLHIDLKGKVAVVTGATGELGPAMARTLAEAGASVAIHYHEKKEKAEELLAEVKEAGADSTIVQGDVTDFDSVKAMRDEIVSSLGDPDIIVNNAVSAYPWKTILEQPPEHYEEQFQSCVMHNLHMTKVFVPAMIKNKWGRVIAINTECAILCDPTTSAYATAKKALDGFVRVLAREIGEHGITVNQVAPGWTISDRDRKKGTERQPEYEKSVPLRRRGTDQEIANVVAFLASDLASYITGAYIPVSGGRVIPGI
jgi:3-oxoacyl-[acyl-carrier protein] reductase